MKTKLKRLLKNIVLPLSQRQALAGAAAAAETAAVRKSILAVALCAVGFAAFAADPLGSKGNPWDIGTPTAGDVEAWTNGTGRLDINGTGAMIDFQSAAPWAGDALSESVVGSDVTVIGANAFAGCPGLKTLVLNEQTPPTLGAGNDFAADVTIFVAAGAADAYRADSGWSKYAVQIEEMCTKKGPDNKLTTHLYEMTYNWWDAVKANDIGEKLADFMSESGQSEANGMSVPHAIPAWFGELRGAVLCTSCRNGNFVGRNFDWGYDDVDECVMHIPAAEGRLASVGVVSWFFPEEMQKFFDVDSFLPELTMDGVNERGVAINVNVVPGGDNGWTTNTNPKASKRLNAGFAVRTVLDNATNAAHAVEILESRNIYSLKPLEFHWMISDENESYVVECVSNALVVLKAKDARPKMSNYYVTHSPSVGEYDILTNEALTATFHTPRAMGIERYANVSNGLESVDSVNAMYTHMTNVWYKLKYLPGNEQKYWSDMNGAPIPGQLGTFTAFDGPELNEARSNAFKHIQANYIAVTNYEAHHEGSRTIDHDECPWLTNEVVHTVHTSIYDIEKRMLRVVVQEDATYSFDAYLITPGSEGNPWVVGGDDKDPTKVVEAWTNSTELVIQGGGTITNLADVAKDDIAAIRITKATVTGAAEDAFKGLSDVALSLPDGWQGELPKDGVWYGATGVTLTGLPLTVRNVKFQQRYPWNGLVDVTFDLSGEGSVKVALSVTVDGKKLKNPTVDGGTAFDLGSGKELKDLRLTWDAGTDFGDAELHQKIRVKLTVEKGESD